MGRESHLLTQLIVRGRGTMSICAAVGNKNPEEYNGVGKHAVPEGLQSQGQKEASEGGNLVAKFTATKDEEELEEDAESRQEVNEDLFLVQMEQAETYSLVSAATKGHQKCC